MKRTLTDDFDQEQTITQMTAIYRTKQHRKAAGTTQEDPQDENEEFTHLMLQAGARGLQFEFDGEDAHLVPMTAQEAARYQPHFQRLLRYQEAQQRRNTRRRERRQWLKTAPREETALRYRAKEKPCTVTLYLEAERFILHWLDEFPGLKGNAINVLLTLAHNILHLLHPEASCRGTTLADCTAFSTHELCYAALDIGFNFNPDPVFKVTRSQIAEAMIGLIQGIDRERLRFNTLLSDISINL